MLGLGKFRLWSFLRLLRLGLLLLVSAALVHLMLSEGRELLLAPRHGPRVEAPLHMASDGPPRHHVWYREEEQAEEGWLRAEEEWLKKENDWFRSEEHWLSEHRGPEVEAWLEQSEKEREKKQAAWPGPRWEYGGEKEKVREWVDREKEVYRRMGLWNDRIGMWIRKGGDPRKPTEWEKQIKERLAGR